MTLLLFSFITSAALTASIFSPHPLMLTIKVVTMATMLCLTLSHSSSWYGYMLFIVIVGGMLVMFMYVSALSPNSIFFLKLDMHYLVILSITLVMTSYTTHTPKSINTQPPQAFPNNFITFFMLNQNLMIFLLLSATLLLAMLISTTLLKEESTPMRPTTNNTIMAQKIF
uniref:NADH dehydrogenase subunit 6 n=1 Tax=Lens contradens TaxID=2771348 RepID=A0A8A3WMQ9_9BIVA|nr:NADH dehydrogenase subunit 6 [Lens contradens]